jgi:hypothetical protein
MDVALIGIFLEYALSYKSTHVSWNTSQISKISDLNHKKKLLVYLGPDTKHGF